MLYLIIALLAAGGIIYMLYDRLKKARQEIDKLGSELADKAAQLVKMRHAIQRLEEINRETAQKKKELHTGGPGAATDIMRDIAGGRQETDPAAGS